MRLAAVPVAIGLALAPSSWYPTAVAGPPTSPLSALVIVPLLAGGVGWCRLRAVPRGPLIHDRQLDVIVCVAASAVAAALFLMAPHHPGGPFRAIAGCLVAAAITAAGWGSRALWQARWGVLVLVLAWREPWAAATQAVTPAVTASTLAAAPALSAAGMPDGATRAMVVHPAVGYGVLLSLVVGVLCGLAAALCVVGVVRRISWFLVGVAAGTAATLVWCAVSLRSADSSAVIGWDARAVTFQGAALMVAAVVAACVVRMARHNRRRRGAGGGTVDAARRIQVAVPRAGLATAIVIALGVGFALLSSTVTGPPGAAAGSTASTAVGVSR